MDTSAFYNDGKESKLHTLLNKNYRFKLYLNKKLLKLKDKDEPLKDKLQQHITNSTKRIKKLKDKLYKEFALNGNIRILNEKYLNTRNIISVFDSVLTRTMRIPINSVIKDIIIVKTYFFDVIEDIILDGFLYDDEKYICLTASAGQIRTKKTVFIKESVFKEFQNTLMCGLTIDQINSLGGVNINKYLAYLALCNSATDVWDDFNINKSIVVEDMETTVRGLVDFIDDKTYEIIRQEMDININHTDGCGMILSSKKNLMVRLPWIKGLLVHFAFDEFIREANKNLEGKNYGIVTDIYGKEWDILKDGIEVIFTKSQFKMYKYYKSWKIYVDYYIKFGCQAGKCNEEEDYFSNAKINYQMLQTLTDMTEKELEIIAKTTKTNIINIGRDRKTMLKSLGVVRANVNKNYIQQALEIYPELLNDTYCRTILKQVKKSRVKEARAGKLDINGIYTFICPDLYAFCEYLFLGEKKPKGLLADGEVFCNLYKDAPKLNCLRSPHLFREHAVRNNVVNDDRGKWFVTNGLYTSCHDIISKILMFDVDGDKSLVCADKNIISIAERNMKDIVPLYYNMAKAEAEIINNTSIYNGLKTAYTGGNIGIISNDITKIWNSANINLNVIKLLCMENNFTIDYAKTLYKPKRPKNKKKIIAEHTKYKTPHFFIYAKDKTKDEVEKINNSVVNKLEKIIPNPKINFNATDLGKFDYKMLMRNDKVKEDEELVKKYLKLDLKKHFMIAKEDDETSNIPYLYRDIKRQLLEVNSDIVYVTDVLVSYLYNHKKANYKTTLWECFGDVIVENIKRNVDIKKVYCENCGDLVDQTVNNRKYCSSCAKDIKKKQNRKADIKYKNKLKSEKAENLQKPHE